MIDAHGRRQRQRIVEGPAKTLRRVARKAKDDLQFDIGDRGEIADGLLETRRIRRALVQLEHGLIHRLHPDPEIGRTDLGEEFEMFVPNDGRIDFRPEQGFLQKSRSPVGFAQVPEATNVQVEAGVEQEHGRRLKAVEGAELIGDVVSGKYRLALLARSPFAKPARHRAAAVGFKVGNHPLRHQPELKWRRQMIQYSRRRAPRGPNPSGIRRQRQAGNGLQRIPRQLVQRGYVAEDGLAVAFDNGVQI